MLEALPPRYAVLERIGSGGMGQVYRALDNTLGREVAVKLLPPELSQDRARLERLRREARVLAHLGHPNIGAIYDLEEVNGQTFLILEYVPGPTLAEQIKHGRIPAARALPLFMQLAEAMGAAHDRGIIHRDLKPANVIVSPDGRVKVLDFGIAKSLGGRVEIEDPWTPSDLRAGPTATGALAGTVGYMSPEQVRGQDLDRRVDIWAFGCLLFEALSGKRAFRGETVADTQAQVLERDPDWSALPEDLPRGIPELLRRCLARDPVYRLRDMGDVWFELDAATRKPPAPPVAPSRGGASGLWRGALAMAVPAAGILVALGFWASLGQRDDTSTVRFRLGPDDLERAQLQTPWVALSPDGGQLVYCGENGLSRRRMDDLAFRRLSRIGNYSGPFFSPDGERIGCTSPEWKMVYFTNDDSLPHTMVSGVQLRGASWGLDDSVLYAPSLGGGLWKVAARGGQPRPVTFLDSTRREMTHRWPEILPGGRAALFTIRTADEPTFDEAEIAVVSLTTGRRWTLLKGGTNPHYVPTGHLLFGCHNSLYAVRFDLAKLRIEGAPVRVLEGVEVTPTTGAVGFALAGNGTMAYSPSLARTQKQGLQILGPKDDVVADYDLDGIKENPRYSPDGRRVLFTAVSAQNDIAVFDLATRTLTRLTFDPAEDMYGLWTPDGREVTFSSSRDGPLNLFQKPADGSRVEIRLTRSPFDQRANSWSPDGTELLFSQQDPGSGSDLWLLDRTKDNACRPWLRTAASEGAAAFSPDGRWVAYESDESGITEVYVRAGSGTGSRWQISHGGGTGPCWSGTGDFLLFQSLQGMMIADITTNPTFQAGAPRRARYRTTFRGYDLSPRDGTLVTNRNFPENREVIVTTSWIRTLKASLGHAR